MCPRMISKTELSHHWVVDMADLQKNSTGIWEPKASCPRAPVGQAVWILVPGLAFSSRGQRLGYGAGFYDRFLKDLAGFKLGLAYRQQIFPKLPTEFYDVNMDGVMTHDQYWAFS